MESIFNLDHQNSNLDNKIIAGLERISQVFKTLLWEKSKTLNLSPIQIQLLIFIQYHSDKKNTVSYLAQEFNVTKPTISDTIKTLEQKQLITKVTDKKDSRSFSIKITASGQKIVAETEDFINPLKKIIEKSNPDDKLVLWDTITTMIQQLNQLQIISVQRTCYNCRYYSLNEGNSFCNLLQQKLKKEDIRIDCPEFEQNTTN
ncbi:MarR family winged helix-turn-helix transcriptional regulator [Flavobacterium sp. NG2]|uniref:MarR family winged helix-turn-helix transcriptional regulator n=1 Tax=Flavobacterium sp. NG2 TaxID=3097547 RepID=UPI002A811239|nr:MarR family winged helix-turn-helix transcriptional regulator [Flavobacterium sp. NG2]WPR70895.1 MarR family winged helix-turn-helix transcriptional regulator [Flavobacterium sp. NG2]